MIRMAAAGYVASLGQRAVGGGLIMDERIILKLILNKQLLKVRNVLSWSRIESNGEMSVLS